MAERRKKSNMREVYLTTADNPFDPRDEFDDWFNFDTTNGYNTCSYLARIAHPSNNLSPIAYNEEVERAIDEIIKYNLTGNYVKKVYESNDSDANT